MRTDKKLAFDLRKQGKSYKEICTKLGMSKSTLASWFRGVDFSQAIKTQLTARAQKESTKRLQAWNTIRGVGLKAHYEHARTEALQEMEIFWDDPLFVSAVTAYWGEGDKLSKNQLRMTNTDPEMLRIFCTFLRKRCNLPKEKMRIALFLYVDLDEKTCKQFWSQKIGITNFHKTMVLPSRHKTKRLPHGICTLVVSNTYLKQKMLVWIDQLPKIVLNRSRTK